MNLGRLVLPCLAALWVLCASAGAVTLTGYYKLDDTSLATAAATVGADGTYNAGFALGDLDQPGGPGDPSGKSVNFPTTGEQFISIPNGGGAGGAPAGNSFSITMWVKHSTLSQDNTYASNHNAFGGTANLLWWRDEDDGGVPDTPAGLVDGDPRANAAGGLMNDTQWHLVALTYNNASVNEQLYIDGTNVTSNMPGADGALSAATITLGNVSTPAADKQFEGLMDEVAFWDRALTAGEMHALYFLSDEDGQFFTDAQGAATLFDFYEQANADSLEFNGYLFTRVTDVTEEGGMPNMSVRLGEDFVLGLGAIGDNPATGGLFATPFVIPEPASIALWGLLGAVGAVWVLNRCRFSA